jgi:hypothetical protein
LSALQPRCRGRTRIIAARNPRFGHIKEANIAPAKADEARLLTRLRAPEAAVALAA